MSNPSVLAAQRAEGERRRAPAGLAEFKKKS